MVVILHRFDKNRSVLSHRSSRLLCLNCRQSGHLRRDCSTPWPGAAGFQSWSHSPQRAEFLDQVQQNKDNKLCTRCRKLDILTMFEGDLWWKTPQDLAIQDVQGDQHYRKLGSVGRVKFWIDCPLCICLFALAPNPADPNEDLHIIADWTIHRVERLAHVEPNSRGRYDLCIMVQSCSKKGVLELSEHLGDALCLLRNDGSDRPLPLSVQKVNCRQFDTCLLQRYISTCAKLHPHTCLPKQSDKLKAISLIHVRTRTLVPYPGPSCEYLTLSYVWGHVDAFRYIRDKTLANLPKTIEDAMTLTLLLGKEYLWVDLFCIDQDDDAERQRQIDMMSDIYGGAFATIIAMSGTSMDSGISRTTHSATGSQPQLSCKIYGKELIGLMPTLSQQIHNCTWGTRAWTFQEAVLSPRCIYLTDHQVYFECNAMQCCESLDESSSWIHQSRRDQQAIKSDPQGYTYGHGTLRKTFDGDGKPKDHFEVYSTLTALYSIRNMTNPNDVIHAYSGIMQHLTSLAYPDGFFWGLPLPEFNYALMWWHPSHFSRRPGRFPQWSWAGWHGQVYPCYPSNLHLSQRYSTYLIAKGVENGEVKTVYSSKTPENHARLQHRKLFDQETILDRIESLPLTRNVELTDCNLKEAEENGYLLLEYALCSMQITHTNPNIDSSNPPAEFYDVTINNTPCVLKSTPGDFKCKSGESVTMTNLALIARDKSNGYVTHYFLEVYFDESNDDDDKEARYDSSNESKYSNDSDDSGNEYKIEDKKNIEINGDAYPTHGSRTGRVYELMIPSDGADVLDTFSVKRMRTILT